MCATLLSKTILVACLLASGAVVHADTRSGKTVTIAADEIVDDDLYIFAQTIVVEGAIGGDLVAFGQHVTVNGTIDGDLTVAAQQIEIGGEVVDDARISGQVMTLKSGAEIGDDLVAGGFSMECVEGSRIGGEVNFGGYQAMLAGHIDGNLSAAMANCRLNGMIGGDVEVIVDGDSDPWHSVWGAPTYPTLPGGLTVTDSAEIAGNLTYKSSREATINPNASIAGEVDFEAIEGNEAENRTATSQIVLGVQRFFALFLVGTLIVLVCPRWTEKVVDNVQQRPLASLGWGLVATIGIIGSAILLLIATIVVAVLLGIVSLDNLLPAWLSIGGYLVSGLIVGFVIFATWVAKIVVSVWAGSRVVNGVKRKASRSILALSLGLLIFVLLSSIPSVGSIISLAVTLIGVGSAAIWLADTMFDRGPNLRASQS